MNSLFYIDKTICLTFQYKPISVCKNGLGQQQRVEFEKSNQSQGIWVSFCTFEEEEEEEEEGEDFVFSISNFPNSWINKTTSVLWVFDFVNNP
jgi:hypothetical protein